MIDLNASFRSLTGKSWRSRLTPRQDLLAQSLIQQAGLSDMLARVLAARDVTAHEAEGFLDPTLRALMPDPDCLVDMAPLVQRLCLAVERREAIAIFGDYDVDGACSAALLWEFLDQAGCAAMVHIPDRLSEGYGPNRAAIEAFHAQGLRLLVSVDCGTTSFDAFEFARSLGMEVLVIDHHQAPEHLPPVLALVNPNRQDDVSGLGFLCAAGVVTMCLVGLNRALRERGFWQGREGPSLIASLDLVALATIADVVPLVGLNRAFVLRGLMVMRARERIGLRVLADVARVDGPVMPYHLGFVLGPRINAGGRIGDATMGVRLLTTRDESEALKLAQQLDTLNRERQALEASALAEAEASAIRQAEAHGSGAAVVVVGEEGWHPGVMGLVSSRLKERLGLPVFALAWTGDVGTGSGRSIAGVDLGRAVRGAVEAGLIDKGGGHAMAAGVTLTRGQETAFAAHLNQTLEAAIVQARQDMALLVDAVVQPAALNVALVKELEKAGPFGAGSPEPVFVVPNLRLVDVAALSNGHLRIKARADHGGFLKAMAFRAADSALGASLRAQLGGELVALAGTLSINSWNGREEVQFRVIDLALMG